MTTLTRLLAIGSIALISMASHTVQAQALPNCNSSASDSNGDGYGWENNASCRVTAGSTTGGGVTGTLPGCQSSNSDPDGDGFGWENGASCLVGGTNSNSNGSSGSSLPSCQSSSSDPDGDGFGWENGRSCVVGSGSTTTSGSAAPSYPSCQSTASDPNGDGYGWENNATCQVTSSTGTGIINDDDSGSSTSNGITDDSGSSTSNGVTAGTGNNGTGGNSNDGGSFTSGTVGGTIIRTTSLPTVTATRASVSSDGGDLFATTPVGDFLLMQNAWRSWRASPGYNWSQSTTTDSNGSPVGWSYDWGPGIPGANGRASDDFYVRSYPELIFGIKDEFRTSATKAEIGFPVRVDSMPTVEINYAFNGPQYGTPRTVDASVNPRFPNGTTISGERNVAVESFLYNGSCDDSLDVSRINGSNHAYEVMVWLDSGAERLPASPSDYVTTVSLRGADYNVYTKTSDNRYIAFVAVNPQTSGTIYWNDFVDWARLNAHVVTQNFGARADSVQIQDSWCVANIIIGTEIFWGAGNFELQNWTITQRQ